MVDLSFNEPAYVMLGMNTQNPEAAAFQYVAGATKYGANDLSGTATDPWKNLMKLGLDTSSDEWEKATESVDTFKDMLNKSGKSINLQVITIKNVGTLEQLKKGLDWLAHKSGVELADHIINMNKGSIFAKDSFTFPDYEPEEESEPWSGKGTVNTVNIIATRTIRSALGNCTIPPMKGANVEPSYVEECHYLSELKNLVKGDGKAFTAAMALLGAPKIILQGLDRQSFTESLNTYNALVSTINVSGLRNMEQVQRQARKFENDGMICLPFYDTASKIGHFAGESTPGSVKRNKLLFAGTAGTEDDGCQAAKSTPYEKIMALHSRKKWNSKRGGTCTFYIVDTRIAIDRFFEGDDTKFIDDTDGLTAHRDFGWRGETGNQTIFIALQTRTLLGLEPLKKKQAMMQISQLMIEKADLKSNFLPIKVYDAPVDGKSATNPDGYRAHGIRVMTREVSVAGKLELMMKTTAHVEAIEKLVAQHAGDCKMLSNSENVVDEAYAYAYANEENKLRFLHTIDKLEYVSGGGANLKVKESLVFVRPCGASWAKDKINDASQPLEVNGGLIMNFEALCSSQSVTPIHAINETGHLPYPIIKPEDEEGDFNLDTVIPITHEYKKGFVTPVHEMDIQKLVEAGEKHPHISVQPFKADVPSMRAYLLDNKLGYQIAQRLKQFKRTYVVQKGQESAQQRAKIGQSGIRDLAQKELERFQRKEKKRKEKEEKKKRKKKNRSRPGEYDTNTVLGQVLASEKLTGFSSSLSEAQIEQEAARKVAGNLSQIMEARQTMLKSQNERIEEREREMTRAILHGTDVTEALGVSPKKPRLAIEDGKQKIRKKSKAKAGKGKKRRGGGASSPIDAQ
eukprot:g1250.t1